MRHLATAAIAAIALVASGAHAQGNGKGNDKGGGKPAAAAQQGGGGQGKGGGGNGNGKANKGAERAASGPSMAQSMRGDERSNGKAKVQRASGNGNDNGNSGKAERAVERAANDRGRGNGNDRMATVDRRDWDDDRDDVRDIRRVRDFDGDERDWVVAGCPPGLAKKNPPCVPPGQVRDGRDGDWDRDWDRPDFWGLAGLDGNYRYNDGYLMRLGSDGRIGSYIPLLGGALGIGNAWPDYYQPVRVPSYYENFYGLGSFDSYRYADDVIYRVDPETAAITSIAALLTGDDFTVGQRLPLGYDVYNVPLAYRDQYVDSSDAYYRYSDGYVYEVDPTTQLIAAAIELIT